MIFYCPGCRQEKDLQPTETKTTKSGRVAYKAICPVCQTDLAEFIPHQKSTNAPTDPQPTTESN